MEAPPYVSGFYFALSIPQHPQGKIPEKPKNKIGQALHFGVIKTVFFFRAPVRGSENTGQRGDWIRPVADRNAGFSLWTKEKR
jgi:hypothetical protein